MNKKSTLIRILCFGLATLLLLAPITWTLSNAQSSQLTDDYGNALAARLTQSSEQAALAGDLLSVRATLEQFTQFGQVAGAFILDTDDQVMLSSGETSSLYYSQDIKIGEDSLGTAVVYLQPADWSSLVILLVIIGGALAAMLAFAVRLMLPKEEADNKNQSGVLVTLELGDLPGLADQLSTHTLNNLYRGLQKDVQALFEQQGGELYLAQGPVLRGLFTGNHAEDRAAQSTLVLKRLTHQWAKQQGVGINRRIAVQAAIGLNLEGDLINNHQRAQVNRRTSWLLQAGQAGDIIFDSGLTVSLPNGLTYREHAQLQIISQLSQPLQRSVDLVIEEIRKD